MKSTTQSLTRRAVAQAKAVWSALEFADRRMFEIRTGLNLDEYERRCADRQALAELEALYAAENVEMRARLTPHGR